MNLIIFLFLLQVTFTLTYYQFYYLQLFDGIIELKDEKTSSDHSLTYPIAIYETSKITKDINLNININPNNFYSFPLGDLYLNYTEVFNFYSFGSKINIPTNFNISNTTIPTKAICNNCENVNEVISYSTPVNTADSPFCEYENKQNVSLYNYFFLNVKSIIHLNIFNVGLEKETNKLVTFIITKEMKIQYFDYYSYEGSNVKYNYFECDKLYYSKSYPFENANYLFCLGIEKNIIYVFNIHNGYISFKNSFPIKKSIYLNDINNFEDFILLSTSKGFYYCYEDSIVDGYCQLIFIKNFGMNVSHFLIINKTIYGINELNQLVIGNIEYKYHTISNIIWKKDTINKGGNLYQIDCVVLSGQKGNYFIGLVGQREELSNYFIIELIIDGKPDNSILINKVIEFNFDRNMFFNSLSIQTDDINKVTYIFDPVNSDLYIAPRGVPNYKNPLNAKLHLNESSFFDFSTFYEKDIHKKFFKLQPQELYLLSTLDGQIYPSYNSLSLRIMFNILPLRHKLKCNFPHEGIYTMKYLIIEDCSDVNIVGTEDNKTYLKKCVKEVNYNINVIQNTTNYDSEKQFEITLKKYKFAFWLILGFTLIITIIGVSLFVYLCKQKKRENPIIPARTLLPLKFFLSSNVRIPDSESRNN